MEKLINLDLQQMLSQSRTLTISLSMLSSVGVASCGVFQPDRIPINVKPVAFIPPAPTPPPKFNLTDYINTLTKVTVEHFEEVCLNWKSIGEPGFMSIDDFNFFFPEFTDNGEDACNWSVTGFTANGLLNFEAHLEKILAYQWQLENQNVGLRGMVRILTKSAGGLDDMGVR